MQKERRSGKIVAIDKESLKNAAVLMSAMGTGAKNGALELIARALEENKSRIASVNETDVSRAERDGLPSPIVKRLRMDEKKVEASAAGLRSLAGLPDPSGRQLLATELDDGLVLRKVTCPIGVIGVIFESRPDALVQIACLCLKSGNAVILKGGSEALETNRLLSSLIREASARAGMPGGWITQLETRAETNEILGMDDCIDLLVPRGSNEFVRYIMDNTRIPVLGHADGVCHCYVDAAADAALAVKVVADSKTQYAAVCNATETLLVHRDIAPAFLPALWEELNGEGKAPKVELRCCAETMGILAGRPMAVPATEGDWSAEYLGYTLAVKAVGGVGEAIGHVNKYGSKHTDAILTEDAEAAREFMRYVDSANVFHNCSTRFSDGFRYGFGAEVGVSTSKIHARGPVGLDGLVTYKYLLSGNGNIVADYELGVRKFTHRAIQE